jgi:hypothetical protein
VDLLDGRNSGDEAGGDAGLNADLLAASEAALKAWAASQAEAEQANGDAPKEIDDDGDDKE